MNVLEGTIIKIQNEGNLSLVSIDVTGVIIKSIIIETPDTAPYLHIGSDIKLYFKETEVVLAKHIHTDTSLRNKVECTVVQIEKGKLLTRLILSFNEFTISSIITTDALEYLKINEKDQVIAMIKSNEVMLSDD